MLKAFGNGNPTFNLGNYKVTQSYLRMEVAAAAGPTQYQFKPLINEGTPFNTENRLNLQDSFVISEIGLFIGKAASATDSKFIPQTYPNPKVFPTGAPDLLAMYAGKLSIQVNNDILIPSWDAFRHYLVPQTQGDIAAAVPPPSATVNQQDASSDGFYPCEPNIILVGSKNNQIFLNMAEGFTTLDANTRLILITRGHLIQNSTVVS